MRLRTWFAGMKLRYWMTLIAFGVGTGITIGYYRGVFQHGPIYSYDANRDRADILKLFEQDRYWLTATPDYSAEHMLDTRSPNKFGKFTGKLKILVMRIDDAFVGFTAYYLKSPERGQLLFLGINPAFRSKGCGSQLFSYALDQLKKEGVKEVELITRTHNVAARTVYERYGFKLLFEDGDGFVYYVYTFK